MTSNTAAVESKTAEIIQFPVKSTFNTVTTPEEIRGNVLQMKILAVEETLSFIVPTLFEAILSAGFKLEDDRLNSTLVSLMRGLMYEHYSLHHPLVEFINENAEEFDIINDDQITGADLDDELDD